MEEKNNIKNKYIKIKNHFIKLKSKNIKNAITLIFITLIKNSLMFLIFNLKIIKPIIKIKTFWGQNMLMVGPRPYSLLFYGYMGKDEMYVTDYLIKNLKEGDIFLDIGANIGFFSLLGSELVGKNGKVYSFEPSPEIYNILYKNTKNFSNIEIYKKAMLDKLKIIPMTFFPLKNHFYNTIQNKNLLINYFTDIKNSSFTEKIIETTSIDNFCSTNNISPKIIKIDAEGSDLDIIIGAEKIITKYKPTILFELLDFIVDDNKLNELIHRFQKIDYEFYQMIDFNFKKIKSKKDILDKYYNFILTPKK